MVDAGGGRVGRLPPEHGTENTARIARTIEMCRFAAISCGRYSNRVSTVSRLLPTATTSTDRVSTVKYLRGLRAFLPDNGQRGRCGRYLFTLCLVAHGPFARVLPPKRYADATANDYTHPCEDAGYLVLHTRLKPIVGASGISADASLLPPVILDPLACAPMF